MRPTRLKCRTCGQFFITTKWGRIYCSPACKARSTDRARAHRRAAERVAARLENRPLPNLEAVTTAHGLAIALLAGKAAW